VNKQLNEDGHFALLLPYHRLEEANEISREFEFNTLNEVSVYQTNSHKSFRVMLMYGKHNMIIEKKLK
jgi:tRNA1Val (adenine37-N6)-methyltransferase